MMQQQQWPPSQQDEAVVRRSVFFSGIALTVERERLRRLFESVGHVVDLRLFNPTPGKSVRHGLVEYMDERSAAEAIARLNGSVLDDRPMRVVAAQPPRSDRKRHRDEHSTPPSAMPPPSSSHSLATGGGGGGYNSRFGGSDTRAVLQFRADTVDPLLGRADTSVLDRLSGMPLEDAYEAVEQLRVLALERPHDAKLLLRDNPVLRSAVVLILQHAGRLPGGNLPPEAYHRTSTVSSNTQSKDSKTTPTTAAATTTTTTTTTTTSEAQRDEVLQLIRCMSEDDVERVLRMSDTDLAAVADVQQRQQLSVLRRRLRDMSRTV